VELLTLTRLARNLGLSRDWLRREALQGRLPHLRAGRRLLFCEDAVKNALLERASQPKEKNL
jgi:excisionase family DNA binding protein